MIMKKEQKHAAKEQSEGIGKYRQHPQPVSELVPAFLLIDWSPAPSEDMFRAAANSQLTLRGPKRPSSPLET